MSYSGLHFPAFELNTERYGVSLCIQSEWWKIRTRITLNKVSSHTVIIWIFTALQAVSKAVGSKGVYVSTLDLYINIYTVPSYLIVILALVNLVLLIIYFRDDGSKVTKKKRQREPGMLRRGNYQLLIYIVFQGTNSKLFWEDVLRKTKRQNGPKTRLQLTINSILEFDQY